MDVQNKIQELQILESNIQSFLAQRQAIQMEINEVENASEELKNYNDEIFKLISGVLIKTDKKKILDELKERKRVAEVKIAAIEKQEKLVEKRAFELKKEIDSATSSKLKK